MFDYGTGVNSSIGVKSLRHGGTDGSACDDSIVCRVVSKGEGDDDRQDSGERYSATVGIA